MNSEKDELKKTQTEAHYNQTFKRQRENLETERSNSSHTQGILNKVINR